MNRATLLLVDDEAAFVAAVSKRLSKIGMTVSAVFDGRSALQYLAENPAVEVVVLDVKMPGMDGIDVLAAIKAKFPLVEVIMLSGYATVESAIEGMKLGAFDYLTKPCDMEALAQKVVQAAGRKREHDAKIIQARIDAIKARRA